MNDERSFERTAREWLELGANQAPDRAIQAVLHDIETTPQERDLRIPWRFADMNKLVAIGLGVVAVVVVALVGAQLLGPPAPSGVGGAPPAEPSATPSPSPTPAPSPSPATPPPLTQTFTSTQHGISVSYPEGWTARAATEPWTDRPGVPQYIHPGFDVLEDSVTDNLFLHITSEPIGDSTPEDWVAASLAGWGCTTTEPIAVDGATGLIGADDCHYVAVTTAGRGYSIGLYTPYSGEGEVFPADFPYDRAWFEEVLATVQLQPEDAVDVAPSAAP